jgi:hypothetical protein
MDKKANANKLISSMVALTLATTLGVPMAALADTGDEAGSLAANSESQPASGDVTGADAASQQGVDESQPAPQDKSVAPQQAANNSQSRQGAAGSAQAVVPQSEGIAEVNGTNYPSLQAAIDAAPRKATVKLLADTKENVTISTPYVTLDLNGHTLNGSTGERKPALTVTARVYVMDSSAAQTGTIMREDTAENSGVSSHYVIDVQGGNSGLLFFQSGNVKNDSGAGGTKGASLVRVGDDSKPGVPGLTISGGTFTQDNFIVLKCEHGNLYVKGGTVNSANSYAIENWKNATIKDNAVINGNVSTWTYGGAGSDLEIQGGTVNGNIESVTYDGAEGKPAKASITGGTVNGTLNTVDYSTHTTSNDPTKATIEVTGGTFSTDPSRYLIEGSAATQNSDGTYGVAKAYLAQVGETSYYTMDEAFKAQTATGKAITLLRDYTTGSTFNSGTEARVVDLNGHTWTCTGTDANSAAFEINYPNASLTVKNGKIVSSQLIGLIPSASGRDGIITYDNSTLTFEGVEVSTTATSGIETNGNNTNDTVVLKDSTLNVPNGFGVYFPCSGALNIENSTITTRSTGVQVCAGNLSLKGSTITTEGQASAKTENDGAILDGAAISVIKREGYKDLGKVEISGGNYTSGQGVNVIKAYQWNNSSKTEEAFDDAASVIAVTGGTFSTDPSAFVVDGYKVVENGGRFTVALNAVTPNPGTSSTETTITNNPDGSTTTTTTNTQTGESTSTTEGANGTTVVVKKDAAGNTTTEIVVPDGAASGPVDIPAAIEADEDQEISVSAPAGTIIAIPVSNSNSGNVVVAVHDDGTQEIIPVSLVQGGKAIVKIDGNETIKIIENAKEFVDVPADHWAADDIDFASSHEIFKGIDNGDTYEPETALTRNMMMTVLARTDGADTSDSDPWYAKGQQWAVDNGVSNGLWGEDSITREQLVTMLFNYANKSGIDTSARADVSGMENADAVSSWATEAVQWAVAEGILKGVDNTDLAPQGLATRAQAAAFMQRYVKAALL